MPPKRFHHKTYSSETSPTRLFAYPTQREQIQLSKSPNMLFDFKTNNQLQFQKTPIFKQNGSQSTFQYLQQQKIVPKFQQQESFKSKAFMSSQFSSVNQALLQTNSIAKQYSSHIKTQPQYQLQTQYQSSGIGQETESSKSILASPQFNQKPTENLQKQKLKKNSVSFKQKPEFTILDLIQKQQGNNNQVDQLHQIQGSQSQQKSQKKSLHQNYMNSNNLGLGIAPILQSNSAKESFLEFYQNDSNTLRKNPVLLVTLQYKMLKLNLQVEMQNKQIYHLVEVVKQEINKYFENYEKNIIGIQTCNLSIPIDYYLSMKERPLLILEGCQIKPLLIEPVFEIENEIQTQKVSLKDFEFLRCIGMGGFSKVYLVKERKTGKYFAMKLIEKNPIIQQNKQNIVQNERDIMRLIDHPFVVKMQFAFESRKYFVFVLEYCSGGELFYLLKKIKRMSEKDAFFYFSEICLGIKSLHSNGVIYRDIKPENILIDLDGHIRIADFGLSKPNVINTENTYSFCGSSEYMAPEMLLKSGHTYQLDLYCLGALLYELITGLPPFYSRNLDEIYQRILNSKLTFPPQLQLSSSIRNLLSNLLAKNPKDRIDSIESLLQHPWMTQWGDQNLYKKIYQKQIQPPHIPDCFTLNFDEKEFGKGESEFLTFIKPLQQNLLENFPKEIILKDFYYNKYQNVNNNEKQKNNGYEQKKVDNLINKLMNSQEENLLIHKGFQINKHCSQQRLLTDIEQKQQRL